VGSSLRDEHGVPNGAYVFERSHCPAAPERFQRVTRRQRGGRESGEGLGRRSGKHPFQFATFTFSLYLKENVL
jgi:hypothetical protein